MLTTTHNYVMVLQILIGVTEMIGIISVSDECVRVEKRLKTETSRMVLKNKSNICQKMKVLFLILVLSLVFRRQSSR